MLKVFISHKVTEISKEECLCNRNTAFRDAVAVLVQLGHKEEDIVMIDQYTSDPELVDGIADPIAGLINYHSMVAGSTGLPNVNIKHLSENRQAASALGRSIELLAEADYVWFATDIWECRRCYIEQLVCSMYGIPILNEMIPGGMMV